MRQTRGGGGREKERGNINKNASDERKKTQTRHPIPCQLKQKAIELMSTHRHTSQ